VSPLKPAEDALLLDNSQLSIEDSVAQVLDGWATRRPFDMAGSGKLRMSQRHRTEA